jgi:hypothetical protein
VTDFHRIVESVLDETPRTIDEICLLVAEKGAIAMKNKVSNVISGMVANYRIRRVQVGMKFLYARRSDSK